MKRIITIIVFVLLAVSDYYGKEVTLNQAEKAAQSFLSSASTNTLKSVSEIELKDAGDIFKRWYPAAIQLKSAATQHRFLYIFNINEDDGFVIIAGDDAAIPVLAYSNSGTVQADNIPQSVLKWLEGYRQQIQYIRQNNVVQTEAIRNLWEGNFTLKSQSQTYVAPLVATQWNQAPYVNDKCPYDADHQELTVTGCPATAMAQIMKYWRHPNKGAGYHSYQHEKYGTLSANFGAEYYNWDAMPNIIDRPNDAVATLMYHCGVAVEMMYNVAAEGGSGSYVIKHPMQAYADNRTVEFALPQYFGYDPGIRGLIRDNYSDNEWKNIIKTELDQGRPVQYAGFGQGGHTFVCDGYDTNDFFHINWGWGGAFDGYFLLDALNPGEGGIGAGAGTYNDDQQALINIKPLEGLSNSYDLKLYNDVTCDKTMFYYGEGFSVSTDIVNRGSGDFNGDYCAAVFDGNNIFIDIIDQKTGWNLGPGYHYTYGLTFTTEGLLTLLPGDYYIYIFSRPTSGDWDIVLPENDNMLRNYFAAIKVINENEISLYAAINLQSQEIYSGGSLSVWLDVANFSLEDFIGIFDVSLYNLEGDFVTTIEEKAGMNLPTNSHYVEGLTFTTNNVDVEPGTYLLALLHQWEGYDYEITGSTPEYVNPIKVIVKRAPFEKDIYEDNDDVSKSYSLITSYIDNHSYIKTDGSNFHVGNDWDFYSVNLETGYKYDIDIKLHDSYHRESGEDYSVDALFLYSFDGSGWSAPYDDVMPASIKTEGGQTIYCVVSPYFLGETGTYLLDIDIQRELQTSVDEEKAEIKIEVHPNPCKDYIVISGSKELNLWSIYNENGKLMFSGKITEEPYEIDVSVLPAGNYYLNISGEEYSGVRKIVKE